MNNYPYAPYLLYFHVETVLVHQQEEDQWTEDWRADGNERPGPEERSDGREG